MDGDLYDEFGNYIGPEIHDSESEHSSSEPESEPEEEETNNWDEDEQEEQMDVEGEDDNMKQYESAVVLHEDKQYYPDAEEVFGDAQVIVQEEDTQDLETPLSAPQEVKTNSIYEKDRPETTYSIQYYASLMDSPKNIRNIAVIGNLQHGKTCFMDMLIEASRTIKWPLDSETRYTDTVKQEQDRHVSIQTTPMSVILEDQRHHPYLFNFLDTPGHINFSGEITAALRLCDGCIICVDAVEGIMMQTDRCIRHAVQQHIPIVILFTKMDRLITELKLPPTDAFFKLRAMLEEINGIVLSSSNDTSYKRLNPLQNNVLFCSATHRWCFSLSSFAAQYQNQFPSLSTDAFVKRLWGDIYYNPETRKFEKQPPYTRAPRTFVQFCLEPIYKLYAQVLGETPDVLSSVLKELHIKITKKELELDVKPLLRKIMSLFFVNSISSIVDSCLISIPSPQEGNKIKVERYYMGDQTSDIAKNMIECNDKETLMINITKMIPSPDGKEFYALGRVLSGTIHTGDQIDALGESYTEDDTEDLVHATVTAVCIPEGRYRSPITQAKAGNIVLLEGLSDAVIKTATVTNRNVEDVNVFKPLEFNTTSVVKLAIEPLKPSELPKMVEGLRAICKSYPLVSTKVEESGEYILMGVGELQLDCVMQDLRELYSHIEIKVADPIVTFCETIQSESTIECFAETPNKKNKITMISEPLEKGLAEDIEYNNVSIEWPKEKVSSFFQTKYRWDKLASRGIWAFGPDIQGPNILLDDTLPGDVDKELLFDIKNSIVQGFKWGCREGPLCEEPIRNVKFKVTGATIASEPIYRSGGQIIPTSRRVVYSSFLLASPALLEPFYEIEIQIPPNSIDSCQDVLIKRRGYIHKTTPKVGTPFFSVQAYIPVMDSFGFETDIRVATSGLAFPQMAFSHWNIVPGDPLDKSIQLIPLTISTGNELARDFMVKTRRRKGLSEDVNESKFFDDSMLVTLEKKQTEAEMM
ncbi:hypothetical protein WA158_006115 [Blastocystis sp. Blastoise]